MTKIHLPPSSKPSSRSSHRCNLILFLFRQTRQNQQRSGWNRYRGNLVEGNIDRRRGISSLPGLHTTGRRTAAHRCSPTWRRYVRFSGNQNKHQSHPDSPLRSAGSLFQNVSWTKARNLHHSGSQETFRQRATLPAAACLFSWVPKICQKDQSSHIRRGAECHCLRRQFVTGPVV